MEKKKYPNDILSQDYYEVDDDDYRRDKNRNKRNNNNNYNNRDNNNYDKHNNDKHGKDKNNPLMIITRDQSYYDRDKILHILTKKDGLLKMVNDLKKWKKMSDKKFKSGKPFYVTIFMKDIICASALPEAIDIVFKKKNLEGNKYNITKKDLNYLMDEILIFLNNTLKDSTLARTLSDKYGEDSLESMIESYSNILYRYNKKKVKKFAEIKNMPDAVAKRLVILTAGRNIQTSIYQLLAYFYKLAQEDVETFPLTNKNIIKVFKICYGKENFNEVIQYLMLEKTNKLVKMSKSVANVWATLDEIMRDSLEKMSKKDKEKAIKFYVSTRRQQESGKVAFPRRLGDRKSIHPDDYPTLTKAFESIEEKDFSVINYLR